MGSGSLTFEDKLLNLMAELPSVADQTVASYFSKSTTPGWRIDEDEETLADLMEMVGTYPLQEIVRAYVEYSALPGKNVSKDEVQEAFETLESMPLHPINHLPILKEMATVLLMKRERDRL